MGTPAGSGVHLVVAINGQVIVGEGSGTRKSIMIKSTTNTINCGGEYVVIRIGTTGTAAFLFVIQTVIQGFIFPLTSHILTLLTLILPICKHF